MTDPVKPFPFAIMAEKAVVSTMLRSPRFIAAAKSEGITSEFFNHPATAEIFDWVKASENALADCGEIDLITLVESLALTGDIERIGGPSAVVDVYNYAPDSGGWPNWIRTLREMRAMRIAAEASHNLAHAADAEDAVQLAKETLEAVTAAMTGHGRAVTGKTAAAEFIRRFESDHAAGDIPGRPTGIFPLDAVSGGMRPGELWVIGGKPSAGKSVLLVQISSAFLDRGETALIFSLELMANEVIGRLVSYAGRIDYGHIMQPRSCVQGDLGRIKTATTKLIDAPLWIDASPRQTADTITAEAERIRDSAGNLALVVVDYLQLIRGGRAKNESREEEIAQASGNLKQLAKLLACPVLTASQLNEDGKTRESRAIEQDADALLIIEEDGLRVAKLRNGERGGLLPLRLDGAGQRFSEYQPEHDPKPTSNPSHRGKRK